MKSIFKKMLNEKGIALLIVLSALALLTTAVVEFAYNEQINYRMAVNAKEKVQAYYLAKSALNFSKLLLVYNKEAEQLIQQTMGSQGGGTPGGMQIEPLYRMMPLSSNLLRDVASGKLNDLFGGTTSDQSDSSDKSDGSEKTAAPEEKPQENSGEEAPQMDMGFGSEEKAQKFLDFDGDFSSEVIEEETKLDLNKIAGLESASTTYDRRKRLLLGILNLPEFKEPLERADTDPLKLTHAISDWVDANDVINEFENVQSGSESSLYTQASYKVKNAKFLTMSELRLVAGMTDEIFDLLTPLVTIYSNDEKINACLGDDNMLKALIYAFTNYANCTKPITYEDEKAMDEIITEAKAGCPDVNAMASSLNSKLGIADSAIPADNSSASGAPRPGTPPPTSGAGQGPNPGNSCAFQFKDLLTKENNVFTIKATGSVGDEDEARKTEVTITTVINMTDKDSTKWKTLYYRIQ